MAAPAIFIPENARLLAPATADDREAYLAYTGVTLSLVSLTTYVIRRRLASGQEAEQVFTVPVKRSRRYA